MLRPSSTRGPTVAAAVVLLGLTFTVAPDWVRHLDGTSWAERMDESWLAQLFDGLDQRWNDLSGLEKLLANAPGPTCRALQRRELRPLVLAAGVTRLTGRPGHHVGAESHRPYLHCPPCSKAQGFVTPSKEVWPTVISQHVSISPRNGLILVMDPDHGELPDEYDGTELLVATDTSLIVETLTEFDGETSIHLVAASEVPQDGTVTLRWEGSLLTTGRLAVMNVLLEVLLETSASQTCPVEVWTDRDHEPEDIYIALRVVED
jgi:hypothetical protein